MMVSHGTEYLMADDGLHGDDNLKEGIFWSPIAGSYARYKMEYFEYTGGAVLQLSRKGPKDDSYKPVPFSDTSLLVSLLP